MNNNQLIEFISEEYGVLPEHPWMKYPGYAVFRHQCNQKWFAVLMDIPKSKLGLDGNELIHVLNVKCDPDIIDSIRGKEGVYPAYHMNKQNWISVTLDNGLDDDNIKWLLDLSYKLTDTKKRPRY